MLNKKVEYNPQYNTVFLLANILTGLVNLTLPTLEAEPCTAVGILSAYTGIVCAAATALARRRKSCKLS